MYYDRGGAEKQVRMPRVLRSASRHVGAGILGVPSSQAFGDGEAARVWVLAAMWVAAAALGILAASLPQPRQVDRLGELFIALAGGATGIGLWSRISRVPSWAVHVLLAGGVVCVSAAVYLAHGGNEFVLLMPSCGIEDALAVCERMRVAGEAPCSIGVTEWAPGEELDALLGRADRALYEAKRAGRGRIVLQDRLQAS